MLPRSVTPPAQEAEFLGARGPLTVSRIWPRPRGRLSLELVSEDGAVLAGQWIADAADRDRIARATRARAAHPGHVLVTPARDSRGGDAGSVLVQARGADRRLRALPGYLADSEMTLLLHRPERRAVVHRPRRAGPGAENDIAAGGEYLRILRPGRSGEVVRVAELAAGLLGHLPCVTIPTVRAHLAEGGVVVTSAVPGRSVREVGGAGDRAAGAGAGRLGVLLRELGRLPPPTGLPVRDADAELAWLGTWLERVAHHLPQIHVRLAPAFDVVARDLDRTIASSPGVVHGDLHDGQVLIAADGGLGVLDWDTLAVGEGALDAANVWAHTDLRRLLGQWTADVSAEVWDAVVHAWGPSRGELQRAAAYRRLILLRLACQYAFRPVQEQVVGALAELASDATAGTDG